MTKPFALNNPPENVEFDPAVQKDLISIVVGVIQTGGEKIAKPSFEIFKDRRGKYRFRLKAPNGEIIAVGQGYKTKEGCKKGIKSVQKNAPEAKVVESEEGEIKILEEKGEMSQGRDTLGDILFIIAILAIFISVILITI